MAFSTGNPIGSSDPRDLHDNAENLDELVNSESKDSHPDRLGKGRKSWHGMEQEFDADQSRREDEFQDAQDDKSQRFDALLAASGYEYLDDYASGIEITEYNQVVRDVNGEFWRLSGSTTLPYTTDGIGLPESGAFVSVGDAALRQQLALDNGYRLVANQMAANAYGTPGKLTNLVTLASVAIQPCGYFDELLWGRDTSNRLHSSSDMGATWALVSSAANRGISQAFRTSDGEVLVQNSSGISKSSGWPADPSSATWSTVLSRPADNVADFLKWGVDGDGQKFIATHYSSTRADSRYVWISTDAGDTWSIVYDSNENDAVEGPLSHIHAACYDPWDGRFYCTEGHAGVVGIYYSDDDGANWTQMTSDIINGVKLEPAFTTMTATDFGIVCGSDADPNGVWLIRRGDDPDQTGIEFYGKWETRQNGTVGFADHSFRDPDTGIVYIGFNKDSTDADQQTVVFACGASGAEVVYGEVGAPRFYSVFAAEGKLWIQRGTGDTWMRADASRYNATPMIDRGNLGVINQGEYTRSDSIRIGLSASASGLSTMAIGHGAVSGPVSGDQFTIAIGRNSYATSNTSMAIGVDAQSDGRYALACGRAAIASAADTVAVGSGASADRTGGVAIGRNASARQGVVIGEGANSSTISQDIIAIGYNASSSSGVAVGANSISSGSRSTAVGTSASAPGTYSSALGHQAAATHFDSIAVGYASESQRGSSMCVGDRHIESTRDGGRIYLKSPNGTLRYISITDAGDVNVTAA